MSAKYTPGPWKRDDVAIRSPLIVEDEMTSNLIALVYSRRIGDRGDLDANGRLIAAAPDLLEALQECEDYFEQRADAEYFPDGAAPHPNEEMKLLTLVRDAIRKAGAE